MQELTLRPPKPKTFNTSHHFLFYSDDFLTYQYGGDPAKKFKQNKKTGTKVDEYDDWLEKTFPVAKQRNQAYTYMLKVVEYNKIELLENDMFLAQHTEFEETMEDLFYQQKHVCPALQEEFLQQNFEGTLAEQHSVMLGLIRMSKKMVHILYKKCKAFAYVQQSTTVARQPKDVMVYLKLVKHERVLYGDFLRKMADLYTSLLEKVKLFEGVFKKIFEN